MSVSQLAPVRTNIMPNGKELFYHIHGVSSVVAAGQSAELTLIVPEANMYLEGAEVVYDVIGSTSLSVKNPLDDSVIKQYGFDVKIGKYTYGKLAGYAAKVVNGLKLSAVVTNNTAESMEIGVNFILHDEKDAQ